MTAPLPDSLSLYGQPLSGRLLLGTAQYPSLDVLQSAIAVSQPGMVTVSVRRQLPGQGGQDFWGMLQALGVLLLPNTAGCHSVKEAINTAMMARELFNTDWIKLELIGDDYTLQPDTFQLVEAAEQLVKAGFKVLPYCTEDFVACQRLLGVGCEVLMPWAAPIGTGKGVINPYALQMLRDRLPTVPMIVDAGLGLPSHAAQVMEWGFDGVLLNSAVAKATDPVRMAGAFAAAVWAGRGAYLAGPMPVRSAAQPSTPVIGTPFWHQAGSLP